MKIKSEHLQYINAISNIYKDHLSEELIHLLQFQI